MKEGVILQCTYCGHEWKPKTKTYGWMMVGNQDKCPKCSDKNIEEKKYTKVDYYEDPKSSK